MRFLGIDTAQANLGLCTLEYLPDAGEVVVLDGHKFKPPFDTSDFIVNDQVVTYVRNYIRKHTPTAAALESPAYGAKYGMVSTGSVHGVLCQVLIDAGIPFVYSTPNKLKYFAAGPAKGGAHTKKVIIDAVASALNWRPSDSDTADAAVLAIMAFAAQFSNWQPGGVHKFTPWKPEWATYVFESPEKGKNRKMAGIFHRPGEFYWLP